MKYLFEFSNNLIYLDISNFNISSITSVNNIFLSGNNLTILKSPLNRFMHQDSELITGIKTGKWIALDGLEMASTQISEKLSPLCGEVPTLNVFESGLEDLNFDSSNINPNFRLFIIYNPSSQNAKKIDQSLFNKCIKFTLPSIDASPRDATTMLYESIIQNSKENDITLWSNLSSRMARYHIEETKKSKENTDLVAGNVPFTSRNLCFISNDFHQTFEKNDNITIESWLQSVFDNYYWRSFINYSQKEKKKFMENTLNIIKSIPDQQYKVDHELDFTEEFKEIVECLIEIQKYAARNIEYRDFEFSGFLNNCLKVPINKEKIQSIYNNLDDTILLLDNSNYVDEILNNKFYQILFIKNNYENILNNFRNVSGFEDKLELNNDQLLKYEDIKLYLLRMRFLNLLLCGQILFIETRIKELRIEVIKLEDEKKKEKADKKKDEKTGETIADKINKISKEIIELEGKIKLLKPFSDENKKIYESNLNYSLFTPFASELSKKLLDLIKYKKKNYFEELVLFLFQYPDSFKIINYYYPYDNIELKTGELKYTNYYIYYWYNLYLKKYNFSVRIKNQRFDIIFPDENQCDKVNPYFILNEENSFCISKGSFLKQTIKNQDEKYETKISYFEDSPEKNTENMLDWISENIKGLYKESPLKTLDEIDKLRLETSNFFTKSLSTLISRIWSLVINLTDKFPEVINYLKKACCFLEKDALEIIEYLYNNLEADHLTDLIQNMKDISFFCESNSESILWKYRVLLGNLELEENKEIGNNKYYDYFKAQNIDADDEILLLQAEMKNLDKLNIYWKEEKIDFYKSKLLTLQNMIISYKNKDIEDAEITKLRSDANALLIHLFPYTQSYF